MYLMKNSIKRDAYYGRDTAELSCCMVYNCEICAASAAVVVGGGVGKKPADLGELIKQEGAADKPVSEGRGKGDKKLPGDSVLR